MCCGLPLPPDEKSSWPGRAFASATNSFTFFAGTDGCTIITQVIAATMLTGSKLLIGSKLTFWYKLGAKFNTLSLMPPIV